MSVVITIVSLVFWIYEILILIRVLLSWFNVNPNGQLVQILYRVTDPLLQPLRRLIPPIGGTLDLSPAVALLLLWVAESIVLRLLRGF